MIPLRHRRLLLALRYVRYLVGLPSDHLAKRAFNECSALHANDVPSSLGDLVTALHHPDVAITPAAIGFDRLESVDKLIELISTSVCTHLSTRFQLGVDRCILPDYKHRGQSMKLRAYQRIPSVSYRRTYNLLVLGMHPLARVRLSWNTRVHNKVPRNNRLCHLCKLHVENEAHALFGCGNVDTHWVLSPQRDTLNTYRGDFWTALREENGEVARDARALLQTSAQSALDLLLCKGDTDVHIAELIGKLASNVFHVFVCVPLYYAPRCLTYTLELILLLLLLEF